MFQNYIVLDFETFYSTKLGYTLRKMTPVEYLLDPRFELIGCAVIDKGRGSNYHDPQWIDGLEFPAYAERLRERQRLGEKLIIVSHNALFDMCLFYWKFGVMPDLIVDTMALSQALLKPKTGKVSLAVVAKYLGLRDKGNTVMKVDGMTRQDIINRGLYGEYSNYSLDDAIICEGVLEKLFPQFPQDEFVVANIVARCAVSPKFQLDVDILHEHLASVKAAKAELLAKAGIEVDQYGKAPALMSNEKFADLLRQHGVDPPMKVSMTTGEFTYAFAKSDQAMADLEEHDDPDVQALVAARIGVKSTLEETRTERFIRIANLGWGPNRRQSRWMPVALRYSGAHTHRLSGDWKLNLQNLPRGGRLRDALKAPPGHVVITCDASQIEARGAGWLAEVVTGIPSELVAAFARGDDVYSLFASNHIYHRTITKKDKKERFVGKQAILGLGYGMGKDRYIIQVRKDSRLQLKIEIILTDEEGKAIVNGYRHGMAPQVPKAWRMLDQIIPELARHDSRIQFGPMEIGYREVTGPTGLKLFYPELDQVARPGKKWGGGFEWQFKSGHMHKTLFGGKFYENIIQHLARCCNFECALKMNKHFGVDLGLQAHDELVYIVPGGIEYETLPNGEVINHPTGFAKEFRDVLLGYMSERPAWAPTWPLAAEAGVGYSYGEAK